MGIFGILIIIPALILYGLLGVLFLKFIKLPINFIALTIFIISGCIAGCISLVLCGSLLSDPTGHLSSRAAVVSMLSLSALSAITISALSVKLASKYNKAQH